MDDVGKMTEKTFATSITGHMTKTRVTKDFLCVMFYRVLSLSGFGVLGQVWYFIVSISALCFLAYFYCYRSGDRRCLISYWPYGVRFRLRLCIPQADLCESLPGVAMCYSRGPSLGAAHYLWGLEWAHWRHCVVSLSKTH